MSDDDIADDLHDVETPFDKQVIAEMDETSSPLELVAALDSFAGFEDAYADWHPAYPAEPLVRFLIL